MKRIEFEKINDATLWTQDEHFKDLDGVKYIEKKY